MDCKIITSQCDREGLGLLLLLFDQYAKLAPIMGLQHSCGSGLEAAGGHEPIGMTSSGMQRPSSPNPQGNSK